MEFVYIGIVIALLLFVFLFGMSRRHRAAATKNDDFQIRDINGVPVGIETDDDMMADVIAATLRTGQPHIANRDANGHVTIQPLQDSEE